MNRHSDTEWRQRIIQGRKAAEIAANLHNALAEYYEPLTGEYILPSGAVYEKVLGYDPRNHMGTNL